MAERHMTSIRESPRIGEYYARAVCECGWVGELHNSLWNFKRQMRDANRHQRKAARRDRA